MMPFSSLPPIVLYGAGTQNLRMVYQIIDAAGFPVSFIVDRDKKKQGTQFWGTEIISPKRLFQLDNELDSYIVVITARTESTVLEIQHFLSDLTHAIIFTAEQFAEQQHLNSRSVRINTIQSHLTDHCNLNCIRCTHMAPLAHPWFLSETEFERDIKQLSGLLNGKLHEYQLAGGEPLLHPECYKFPYIIRKYFHNTDIVIITNGTMLGKMRENFFRSCRENCVQLWVTVYPISLDIGSICELLVQEHVDYVTSNTGVETGAQKEMWAYAFHLNGDRPGQKDFEGCFLRNFILRNGKLFLCPQAAYSDIFNSYFGTNLPTPEQNGVDIYTVKNLTDLMCRIIKKNPFCDYCNPLHRQSPIPFAISKCEITEWVDPASLTEEDLKKYGGQAHGQS